MRFAGRIDVSLAVGLCGLKPQLEEVDAIRGTRTNSTSLTRSRSGSTARRRIAFGLPTHDSRRLGRRNAIDGADFEEHHGHMIVSPFGLLGLWLLTGAWRSSARVADRRDGFTFCRAGAHPRLVRGGNGGHSGVAGSVDLIDRLTVRAVRSSELRRHVAGRSAETLGPAACRGAHWHGPLDLLSPSSTGRIAQALRACSDGATAVQVRRVARRPFRGPRPREKPLLASLRGACNVSRDIPEHWPRPVRSPQEDPRQHGVGAGRTVDHDRDRFPGRHRDRERDPGALVEFA